MDLPRQVEVFLRRHGLMDRPGVVAISGGPDSVALAHVLARLIESKHLSRLVLAHLNHQLRGQDSDADETFVHTLPGRWNIEGITSRSERMAIQSLADDAGSNLEATARRARYDWLTRIAQAENADWIATGHTADDQAETVLFRLLRGTGLAGLSGIAPMRILPGSILVIRPLLNTPRKEVMEYLRAQGQECRLDGSNADVRFSRNRIRHELLPMLQREYNPNLSEVLASLADQAHDWTADFEARGRALLESCELPSANAIRIFRLADFEPASDVLVTEVFRQVWRREPWPMGEMGHSQWKKLLAVARGEIAAWSFPGGVHARHARHVLQLERTP